MRFLKQNSKTKADQLTDAAKHFEKTPEGKQIVAHSRVRYPNEPAVNVYIDEDGAELIEDDQGNAVERAMLDHPKVRSK